MKSSSLVSHLYRRKQQVQEEKRINNKKARSVSKALIYSMEVYVLCHIPARIFFYRMREVLRI
jgi:hypothetical protein